VSWVAAQPGLLLTGALDGRLILWDVASAQPLQQVETGTRGICWYTCLLVYMAEWFSYMAVQPSAFATYILAAVLSSSCVHLPP
jgi:hypothetical protein